MLLKSVTFAASTFPKTETLFISLMFAMDATMLSYVLYRKQTSKVFRLKAVPRESLAICRITKVIVCLSQVA